MAFNPNDPFRAPPVSKEVNNRRIFRRIERHFRKIGQRVLGIQDGMIFTVPFDEGVTMESRRIQPKPFQRTEAF